MTTPPPIKISDEAMAAAGRAAAEEYARWNADHPARRPSFAVLVAAVAQASAEAVAPLIAAQVLRPCADLPTEIRGDGPCGDCGTADNIIWVAESALWNFVMGGPGQRDDPGGIVCVPCFVVRAHAAGLAPIGWRLVPDWHWETTSERAARVSGGTQK